MGNLVTQYGSTLSGAAISDKDWSCGQVRGFVDITTGDKVWPYFSGSGNAVEWWSEYADGTNRSKIATNFTTPDAGFANQVQGTIQASDGSVHLVSFHPSTHVPYYTRCTLTRSGGHVTGVTIDQAKLALPSHSIDAASDPRGGIILLNKGGTEKLFCWWQGSFGTNATVSVYGVIIGGTSGSTTNVGLGGTGTDTQLYTASVTGNLSNHAMQFLAVQEPTSGDIVLFGGPFNTDFSLGGVAGTSDYNVFRVRFATSGSNWGTTGTQTTIHSVPGGGGDEPNVCCAIAVAGKAALLYYDSAGILKLGYADASDTWTDAYLGAITTNTNKSAFAVMSTDGTTWWVIWTLYGVSGTPRAGGFSTNSGGSWTTTAETSPPTALGMHCIQMANGVKALRDDGSTLAQTNASKSVAELSSFTLDQNAFRARNDDGSETTATWAAAQSTNLTFPKDTNLRLRYLLNAVSNPGSTAYQLEYKLSTDSNYLKVPLDSSSNIASVGTMGTGTSSTSTTTIVTTTATNALAIGDTAIIVAASDNTSTTNGDNSEVSGVTDSVGNTWTKLAEYTNGQGSAAAGTTVSVWMTYATVALPIGGSVTVTYGSARIDKTTSIWKFTSNRKLQQSTTSVFNTVNAGNGFGSNAFSGLSSKQRLYFMGGAKEANSTTALTVSTNFTTITPQRSRNNAAAQMVRGEFRVNTSTGETSNPTLAVSGDTVSVFVALEETPPPITMSASSNIAASAATATTSQLTGGTGTFTAGRISDDTNPMPAITIASGGNSEFEYSVQALSANGVADAQAYNLRISIGGVALDTYTNALTWTIGASGNIAPSVGSIALTGIAPVVTNSGAGATISPTVGSIALTGIAPSVLQGTVRVPTAGVATLTGNAPTVIQGVMRSPTVGSVALTGTSAVVTQGLVIPGNAVPPQLSLVGQIAVVTRQDSILAGVSALTLSGNAPTINIGSGNNTTITAAVGSLSLTGQFPIQDLDLPGIGTGSITLSGIASIVTQGTVLIPNAGALTITGQTVAITQQFTIVPSAGALVLTEQTVNIIGNKLISPSAGSVNLTGNTASVTQQIARAPTVGSISLSGIAPVVSQGLVLNPNSGQLTLTGIQAQVGMTVVTAPAPGSLSLVGQFPVISQTTGAPGTGNIALSGNSPAISQGTVLTPSAGQITLTGTISTLGFSYTINPLSASVVLQGVAPSMQQGVVIAPNAGSATLTSIAPVVSRGTLITPAAGSVGLSGQSAQALASQVITPITGALFVTGNLPNLVFGVIKPPSGNITLTGYPPLINVYDPNSAGNMVGPGARLKLKLNL